MTTNTQEKKSTIDVDKLRRILSAQGSIDLGEGIILEQKEIPEEEDERNCPRGPIHVIDAMAIAYQIIEDNETNHGPKIYNYFMSDDEETITASAENLEKANKLFDYYGVRFFHERLKNPSGITPWQDAVMKFVAVKDRNLQTRHVRILSTIPRFMEVDLLKEKYSDISHSVPKHMEMFMGQKYRETDTEPLIVRLKFLEKFHNHNSNKNAMTYLFRAQSGILCEYEIPTKNHDQISMLDYLIEHHEVIKTTVNAKSKPFFGDFNSLKIITMKILLDQDQQASTTIL